MEQTIKIKILDSIGKVFEESKCCQLEDQFLIKIDKELSFLATYFKTTKSQAFFIALVFALNYRGDTVDLNDLIVYLDCNPMTILKYSDDLQSLYAKGVFFKQKSRHRINLSGANDQFTINGKISEAILSNKPMPDFRQEKMTDFLFLLQKLSDLVQQREDQEIATYNLLYQTEELIAVNGHFPLIEKIAPMKLETESTLIYLHLLWQTLLCNSSTDIGVTVQSIFDNAIKRVKCIQKLLTGDHMLVKNKLIEIVMSGFFNDAEMKLSARSIDLMNDCGIKLFTNKPKKDNVLKPSDIKERKLYFSDAEMEQLFLLKDLMHDQKLKKTQKRLAKKKMPIGITVLLHGAPGTGKTEIVKQIGKETNRLLMKVDISESKSAWFGESEKIIKKIFTEYKAFAEECDQTPILFFNEADAIFSKRRDIGNYSVAQTENTIQNIMLEELENFEGILIATTNLTNNLDAAFERRFLFKIRFQKPDTLTRAKIWKSKLPFLSNDDCMLLAAQYDFSGGQIDNVVRKSEIQEVIRGGKVKSADLMIFCNEEVFVAERAKLGFVKKT